jgi:5'-nucleotidase (lipoprotein e(P4) family)
MSHLARGTSAGGAFEQHRSWSFLLMLLLFCGGCSEVRDSHELLHSLLWMRTSAEYHVLSVMTYQRARDALDRALIDTRSTASIEQTGDFQHLPPAVILDLDETVLDNSPFEARLIAQRTTFNQPMWEQWVQEASAQAVPGVLEFIAEARKKGGRLVLRLEPRGSPGILNQAQPRETRHSPSDRSRCPAARR